jgi:hypothetical protein
MRMDPDRFHGLNAVVMRCEWHAASKQLQLTVECLPAGADVRWTGVQSRFGDDANGNPLTPTVCEARYHELVATSWRQIQLHLRDVRVVLITFPIFSDQELHDVYTGKPFRWDRIEAVVSSET